MASITMPQLGESVTEGTVAKWLKREGEAIAKYEPLVEVITDKVNSEIPSPEAGVVSRIVVSEGQTVKVGAEIAVIEPDGGRRTADGGGETADGATASPGAAIEQGAMDAGTHQQAAAAPTAAKYTEDEVRRRSSPLVRRLAKEHGVDLNLLIPGSGTGGRVNKDDILAYIATGRSAPEVSAAVPAEVPV